MADDNFIQDFLPDIHRETDNQSKYYDVGQLCQAYHDCQTNLSVMYANSRSLARHVGDYKNLFDCIYETGKVQFDILCFVET